MNYLGGETSNTVIWILIAYFLVPVILYKPISKWLLKKKWNVFFYSTTQCGFFAAIFSSLERNWYFDASYMPIWWGLSALTQLLIQLIVFLSFYAANIAIEKTKSWEKTKKRILYGVINLALLTFLVKELITIRFLSAPEFAFTITYQILLIIAVALLVTKPILDPSLKSSHH